MRFIVMLLQLCLFQLNSLILVNGYSSKQPLAQQLELTGKVEIKHSTFITHVESNSINEDKSLRTIFIYLEPHHFTKKYLRESLSSLANAFPNPQNLEITAFSDKQMLDRAIKLHFSQVYVRFSSSPAGRKAEKEWASNNEPLPTGYYRAFLSRTKEKEIIVYSPDPKKDSLKKLISRKAKK